MSNRLHGAKHLLVASVALIAGLVLVGCTPAASTDASAKAAAAHVDRPTPNVTPAPQPLSLVAEMTPATGSISGGEAVTFTGKALDHVTGVTFDGVAATNVKVTAEGAVTATVPRTANYQPGAAEVVLIAGQQAVPAAKALSYEYTVETPVDKQMTYALTYWKNYNISKYGDFNPGGGDCANFVSQTLVARGWKPTGSWYNHSGNGSRKWAYAPALDTWLENDSSLEVTRLTDAQRDQVKVGDIAFFDWNHNGNPDHVMIVSDVIKASDGTIDVKLAGHNLNYDFRDLDVAITKDHPGGEVWYYSIP